MRILIARLYYPKRKPRKSAFKSSENYQQQKNIRGFRIEKEIILHQDDRRNPCRPDQVRSGSPRPKNARARLEQEENREAIQASAQAAKQSNTPSSETKLDQVRASIAKNSGKSAVFQ